MKQCSTEWPMNQKRNEKRNKKNVRQTKTKAQHDKRWDAAEALLTRKYTVVNAYILKKNKDPK